MNALLTAVLAYAREGLPVFPIVPRGKRPLVEGGFKAATKDADKIREWWTRWPDANIATPTGAFSGRIVIDLDGEKGIAAMRKLIEPHGKIGTLTAKTGGGGLHLHLQHPGRPIKNSASKIAPGVDVRGDGGYIVLPPSVHANGKTYTWIDPAAPLQPCPDWLLALLEAPPTKAPEAPLSERPAPAPGEGTPYGLAALARQALGMMGTPEGSKKRNHTLNKAAFSMGQLVSGGELPRDLVEDRLLRAALGAGLGDEEARKTIRSGMDAGALHPKVAPVKPADLAPISAQPAPIPDEPIDDIPDEDGALLLADVDAFLGRFIVFPRAAQRIATVLWIAHTHAIQVFESSPRLAFLSPEKRSGKTRAEEVSELLVARPMRSASTSAAALFRAVSLRQPTLLFDEVDAIFAEAGDHEELRGLLNAGHRRGATVLRCVEIRRVQTVQEFPVFAAVALAGIGNLPDTILDRSIVITMRRRAAGERVEPFRVKRVKPKAEALRRRLAAWIQRRRPALEDADPVTPDALNDRAADCWEPLLAIADAAGGDWPSRARAAALELAEAAAEQDPSWGVRLLGDIRRVFDAQPPGVDRLRSSDLAAGLTALEEAPWADLRGRPIDAGGLAYRLRAYGIHSKNLRLESGVVKGYSRADFEDAWSRYIAPPVAAATPLHSPAATFSATSATLETVKDNGAETPPVAGVAADGKGAVCSGSGDATSARADLEAEAREIFGPDVAIQDAPPEGREPGEEG